MLIPAGSFFFRCLSNLETRLSSWFIKSRRPPTSFSSLERRRPSSRLLFLPFAAPIIRTLPTFLGVHIGEGNVYKIPWGV
jgi:hypothetical protein